MNFIKGNPGSPLTPPYFEGERNTWLRQEREPQVLSINPNDMIADINKKNMYSIGTYLVSNMKNDLDSIQITFQEMMSQSIHMLDVLTKMVESQEQQYYINQEIQYPDTIFMNDSEY